MEDAILEYLNAFGQPQAVNAIHDNCAPEAPLSDVQDTLDEMTRRRRIKLIQAGVHANGEPTMEYSPRSFDDTD